MSNSTDHTDMQDLRPAAIFDVCGTKYKVNWSVLDSFPDSLLSTSARVAQEKAGEVVPIERGAASFPSLVAYMRDPGNDIWLPPHVATVDFVKDADYFGIEIETSLVHSGAENVAWAQQASSFREWDAAFQESLAVKKKLVELEIECANLAAQCIYTYSGEAKSSWPRVTAPGTLVAAAVQTAPESKEMQVVCAVLEKYGLKLVLQEGETYYRFSTVVSNTYDRYGSSSKTLEVEVWPISQN